MELGFGTKSSRGLHNQTAQRTGTSIIDVMPLDDNPLAVEIQQETAAAYFAACRKMVDSIEALNAFDRAVASSTRDNEQLTRRSELLEDAVERVYFLVIQREAMKF